MKIKLLPTHGGVATRETQALPRPSAGSGERETSIKIKLLPTHGGVATREVQAPPESSTGSLERGGIKLLPTHGGVATREMQAPPESSYSLESLIQRIEELGWRVHPRQRHLQVDLESGHDFFQAEIAWIKPPLLMGRVEWVRAPVSRVSASSRQALGWFSQRVGQSLRVVRPSLEETTSAELLFLLAGAARLDETEGEVDAVAELISALSVGCRWFGREARALLHESIAQLYCQHQIP